VTREGLEVVTNPEALESIVAAGERGAVEQILVHAHDANGSAFLMTFGAPFTVSTLSLTVYRPALLLKLHTPLSVSAVAPSGAPSRIAWSPNTRRSPTAPLEPSYG